MEKINNKIDKSERKQGSFARNSLAFALATVAIFMSTHAVSAGEQAANLLPGTAVTQANQWRHWVSPQVMKAGGGLSFDNGSVKIKTTASQGSGDIQLLIALDLEPSRAYQLKFRAIADKDGKMPILYNMRKSPFTSYAFKIIDLQAGDKEYSCKLTVRKNKDGSYNSPRCLRLYFGRLQKTTVTLSDISLCEEIPLTLGDSWKVFLDVKPPSSMKDIPAQLETTGGQTESVQTVTPDGKKIDMAKLSGKIRERNLAVVYNEFTSSRKGIMRLGCAADYWFEAYLNGQKLYACQGGNGPDFTPRAHTITLPVAKGRNILALKIWSGSRGWSLVWDNAAKPRPNIKFAAGPGWKAVNMSDLRIKPGSALDLSSVSRVSRDPNGRLPRLETGKNGRLTPVGGKVPLRLKATTLSCKWFFGNNKLFNPGKEEVSEFISQALRQGYNMFRLVDMDNLSRDADLSIKPELMDKADYLLYQMGKQGAYAYLTMLNYTLFTRMILNNKVSTYVPGKTYTARNDYKLRMYLGDPEARQYFTYGVEKLLTHVNPYTGIAWKDDPAILCIEFYNEQELGLLYLAKNPMSPETREKFNLRFRSFLKDKYSTVGKLSQAWGDAKIESFDHVTVPFKFCSITPRDRDFVALCNELSRECFDWYESVIRKAGYKGLTAQYDLPAWFGDSAVRYEKSQVALAHRYYSGIENFGPYSYAAKSALGNITLYWPQINTARFADRPFFVTETAYGFWNRYQHEEGILFGAYSALQGFDAIARHATSAYDPLNRVRVIFSYGLGANPVARASEFLKSCLWQRGDVMVSPHLVELAIPESYYVKVGEVSTEQSKIGLVSGMALTFPGVKKRPDGTATSVKADMTISPSGNSAAVVNAWWVDTGKDIDSEFSMAAFAKALKQNGILPTSNITDPAQGVFQSDTGEITLRTKENLLKVVTARSEAVSLEANKREKLGLMELGSSSVPACIAACAVDKSALRDSKRIVLIYSTAVRNTGMEVSHNQDRLFSWGRLPVLMQTGSLQLELENCNGGKMSLYALGFDGSRREKLPVKFTSGKLHINIDTARLKDGPTPFFELATE